MVNVRMNICKRLWRVLFGGSCDCALSKTAYGNRLDPRNLRNRFISSCRILGKERQKHLTIHHGRHSFISHSLAGGRSLPEVRDAVGHSSLSITSIYAHIVSEDEGNGNLFAFEGDSTQ
ncbi:MAG: tyrosine-type recombinase/integrase [Planctomycetota bacterium]|jgi:site-specific recombinase XerC